MSKTVRTDNRAPDRRRWSIAGALACASILLVSSTAGASSQTRALSERDNGHLITLGAHAHLTITLHDTYWRVTLLPSRAALSLVSTRIVGAHPLPRAASWARVVAR